MGYNKQFIPYHRICVLDTETTSRFWNSAAPVQIAAIIVDDRGNVLDKFNERIRTSHKIDPGASAVNHIYAKDLVNCRTEAPVLTDFVAWIIGNKCDCLLSYNGRAFDLPMLNRRCKEVGLGNIKIFDKDDAEALPHIDGRDTVLAAKKTNLFGIGTCLGRKWKLTLISELLGINSDGAHDAFVDITRLKDVFFTLDPFVNPSRWATPSTAPAQQPARRSLI